MQIQIPQNWKKTELKKIARITTGSTNSQDAVENGKYPLFDRSMTIKRSNKFLFDREAVIIPGEGKEFKPRFYSGKFDLHQRAYAVYSLNEEIENKFLYYLLLNSMRYFSQFAVGSTVKSLRLPIFENLSVLLPSRVERENIVNTLSTIDDKIEVNNKIAKTLEQMAQNIFKEWFVTNKKDSWIEQNIGDVCKTYGGGTPSTKEIGYWKNGTIFWATPTDMTSLKGPFIFRTEKFITEIGLKKSSANLLPKGTILLTSRATVGILAISKVPISTNQGFICIVCKEPLSNFFMYCWLKRNVRLIQGLATGSTFPEISRGVFRKIKIVVPDNGTLDEFNGIVKPIFVQISKIIQENQKLTAMRDLLLPKLMRGEIRV